MDRASDSGSEGWGFESLLAYHSRSYRSARSGDPNGGSPDFRLYFVPLAAKAQVRFDCLLEVKFMRPAKKIVEIDKICGMI